MKPCMGGVRMVLIRGRAVQGEEPWVLDQPDCSQSGWGGRGG